MKILDKFEKNLVAKPATIVGGLMMDGTSQTCVQVTEPQWNQNTLSWGKPDSVTSSVNDDGTASSGKIQFEDGSVVFASVAELKTLGYIR
jgi:hypothetical protein